MKAINTLYNGNYFRSRLEAKWAYFFDELGVPYQYEPEGFTSDSGDKYLPDFYLPETYLRGTTDRRTTEGKGVYIEIKPGNYKQDYIRQSEWFTKNLVMFLGMPHENLWYRNTIKVSDIGFDRGYELHPGWDNCMGFWICSNCNISKIDHAEGGYNGCPICSGGNNESLLTEVSTMTIKKRFEHGAK